MFDVMERYREMYAAMGKECRIVEDNLWVVYNRMIVPVGPIKHAYRISDAGARQLLSGFKSAFMVRCTGGFSDNTNSDWYALYIDKFYEVSELDAAYRTKIRKGLKTCRAERVEPAYFLHHGYHVYQNAIRRYKRVYNAFGSETAFKKDHAHLQDFQDIQHVWGVFYDNKPVGFMVMNIYGSAEAHFSWLKLHPDYLRYHPTECLFYRLLEFYLKEQGFEYMNASFRNLLHPSAMQEFLLRKFAFTKQPLNLWIYYRPTFRVMLRLASPFRPVLGKISPQFGALFKLDEIRQKEAMEKPGPIARAGEFVHS